MLKKYNLICLLILASLAGCKKEFLKKDPQALTVDQNFYQTNEDMISAVNAAYDPLGWETDRAGAIYANPFFFGDVASDDALKGGGSAGDIANFFNIESFTANAGFPEVLLPWQRYYTGIYRANLVIEKAPLSQADNNIKNRVTGEALFLRALYHFELIKMYGDVPLITKVLTPDEYTLSRTAKAEVFSQIEADFTAAAAALPVKGSIQIGRATKGAALALLARAQMYQTLVNAGKWTDVLQNSESVINSGIYSLEPNYTDIHTVAHEDGIESIFEIEHASQIAGQGGSGGSNWASGNEGTFTNIMFRGRANGGWGFNCPSKDLLKEFKLETDTAGKEDPRLKATIIQNGDIILGGESYVADPTVYPNTGTYCRKYVEPLTVITKDALNQSDGPSNGRLIRYADVLLMAAEAANELGQTAKALGYLKMVRDRVGMPEITQTDKILLRGIIWRERRIELALEGHRFFDIVRQGRAASIMQNTIEGYRFTAGKNEVFPIPQSEIDVSKGQISQNPGY
jgi:starch-binding outer membrane protein, SusD/RagB family